MTASRGHKTLLDTGGSLLTMLGKNRVNRHLYLMGERLLALFSILSKFFNSVNTDSVYLIDSLFVAADNLHFPRARFYPDAPYQGYLVNHAVTAMTWRLPGGSPLLANRSMGFSSLILTLMHGHSTASCLNIHRQGLLCRQCLYLLPGCSPYERG